MTGGYDDDQSAAAPQEPEDDDRPFARPTRAVAWTLLPAAVGLPVLSAALWRIAVATASPVPTGVWHQLWNAFDIGAEGTVAVWYGAMLWILLALCAVVAALLAPRHRPSWWLFAAVCLVASADESSALHERLIHLGDGLRPYMPFDVFYSWVIPGTLIALVVIALLMRVVLALRPTITLTLVLAGLVFLAGALVIETATGFVHLGSGGFSSLYVVLTYIEETFELLGVSLAVVALASMFLIRRGRGTISVRFAGYRRPGNAPEPESTAD